MLIPRWRDSSRTETSLGKTAAVRAVIEVLEDRRLLSRVGLSPSLATAPSIGPASLSALSNPSITATRPANGATNVNRDIFIAADLNLPNPGAGVDATTLTLDTVKIYRTSDKQFVNAHVNTSGGGDTIVSTPTALLAANTNYTFEVTSGLKDTSGASFTPFKMTFTTGNGVMQSDPRIAFSQTQLSTTTGKTY